MRRARVGRAGIRAGDLDSLEAVFRQIVVAHCGVYGALVQLDRLERVPGPGVALDNRTGRRISGRTLLASRDNDPHEDVADDPVVRRRSVVHALVERDPVLGMPNLETPHGNVMDGLAAVEVERRPDGNINPVTAGIARGRAGHVQDVVGPPVTAKAGCRTARECAQARLLPEPCGRVLEDRGLDGAREATEPGRLGRPGRGVHARRIRDGLPRVAWHRRHVGTGDDWLRVARGRPVIAVCLPRDRGAGRAVGVPPRRDWSFPVDVIAIADDVDRPSGCGSTCG